MVTGGAGFIGSALVRHLIAHTNHQILNFDKLTYAASTASLEAIAADPRYRFTRGDICDSQCLAQVLEEFRPDVVVNLAAETHVDRSIDGPAAFVRTNLVGTFTLLEQVRQHYDRRTPAEREAFRFLHVSTDEVFGSLPADSFANEASAYDPRSPYSASKAGSDHLVRAWGHTYGLPTLVTFSSNNYGPFQFPEKLIPLIVGRALTGMSLPVFGDGQHIRDWLFVDDHARALHRVFEAGIPGESYGISSGCQRSNIDVVRAICAVLDRERPRANGCSYAEQIEFVVDRPGHDRRYALDASKIRTSLGWQPEWSFDDGIGQTVTWYLENESWWRGYLRDGYAERAGLPVAPAATDEESSR